MSKTREYTGPDEHTRRLASVPDARILLDLRNDIIAIAWTHDDVWQRASSRAERYDKMRAEMVENLVHHLRELGANATIDAINGASKPLLGAFISTGLTEPEHDFHAAVEVLRHDLMHRLIHIRSARDEVAQWDSPRVRSTTRGQRA